MEQESGPPKQTPQPLKLFFCYVDEDEIWLQRLTKQLSPWKQQGIITMGSKLQIPAGQPLAQKIQDHIDNSQIIMLLVSVDFISNTQAIQEVEQVMRRYGRGEVIVIPVILRPAHWEMTDFGKLKALPEGGKPVTTWWNRELALYHVAKGLQTILQSRRDEPLNTHLQATLPDLPKPPIPRRTLLVGGTGTALILVAAGIGGFAWLSSASRQLTTTSTPTTHPLQSPTPTSTPPVTPRTVLYQADLSKPDNIYKEWQGSILSGESGWQISNGALLSSGNNTDETIWAQSVLPTANYAVEVSIQVLTLPDGHSYSAPAIGLLLRSPQQGWPGYLVEIGGSFVLDTAKLYTIGPQGPIDKSEAHYPVDMNPHTYRAEVVGTAIKLIIDTVTIFEDTDKENLFPSSGQVGLMTSLVPVKVTSFKVIAL